jgi:capsular polysaccharide biosynthesis protein
VTIDEALHRIVRGHWILILLSVYLPVALAVAYVERSPELYEAVGRVQLGSDLAASNVQADASSERALGIATSPGVVRRALDKAGVKADAGTFAKDHVDVRRVGVSPVIEIAISDPSPERAATMARSITDDVLEFSNAGDRATESATLKSLDDSITKLSKSRDDLIPKLATATPNNVIKLQAEINAVQSTLTEQQRQRSELALATVSRSSAVLLDAARAPTVPMPRKTAQIGVLAGLLGLLAGLGMAAARETVRPTLHSPRAISYAVNAPVLGHVPGRDTTAPSFVRATGKAADRIALIALGHGATKAMLIPVRESDDVWARMIAEVLSPQGPATAHRLPSVVVDGQWVDPGPSPAGVILSPTRIKASELQHVQELLGALGWPVLGLLTYEPTRRSWRKDFPLPTLQASDSRVESAERRA